MRPTFVFLALLALFGATAHAQHQGHATAHPDTTSAPRPGMASATDPQGPMGRDGSGTAWLPDAAPMEAVHTTAGGWALMLHGAAFPRFTAQDAFDSGTRGEAAFGTSNWAMGMAQRPVGPGRLTLRAMLSADPLTEGGNGYPLLLQSGETFNGERLVDRQHPHDLLDELAVLYAVPLGDRAGVFGYAAYPGEPALGPPAFMHRPSARLLPDAPIGHHWQDATHIAWGVATAGVVLGPAKLDASLFTGAEPDEDRYTPDPPRFDSYSARLSVNSSEGLAFQLSRGFLREPEALEPGVDVWRTTASLLYSQSLGGGDLSTALVWGMNEAAEEDHGGHGRSGEEEGHHGTTHALLGEATLSFGPQAVFGRAEWTQKPPEELDLSGLDHEPLGVGQLAFGTARDLARLGPLAVTLGAQATLYRIPDALRPTYGARPVSLQVFLRLAPSRMVHGHGPMNHEGMH